MTVSTTQSRVQYAGNGATTDFEFPYAVQRESDLRVSLVAADGTTTVQTINTHYTVTTTLPASSATVHMLSAPASGETLLIERVVPLVQDADFRNAGVWRPENVETALDRAYMALQQMQYIIDNWSGKLPEYTSATLPAAGTAWYGRSVMVRDVGGVSYRYTCHRKADDSYVWVVDSNAPPF